MAIYTRKGDKGKTGIFLKVKESFVRVSKDDVRISTLGAIDEANSALGLVASFTKDKELKHELASIQRNMLKIGSIIAGANIRFSKSETNKLEKKIDYLEGKLPALSNFILPGGTNEAALLHFVRTLVRRSERELVRLAGEVSISENILAYINRLSDYLFMRAREINASSGIPESIWRKGKK